MMIDERGPFARGLDALSHWKLVFLLTLVSAILGISGASPLFPAL